MSSPIDEKNPPAYWLAADGAKFKQQRVNLLAQSLLIGLETAAASPPEGTAFRTIRYLEGKSEKVERVQIVEEKCDRMVIRNLRGMLVSVPVTAHPGPAEKAASCNS